MSHRFRRALGAMATLGLLAAILASSPAAGEGGVVLQSSLTGLREVAADGSLGAGDPEGFGAATMEVDDGSLCYRLSVTGVDLPTAAAHVHRAPVGQNGGVVVPLTAPGQDGRSDGCVGVARELGEALATSPEDFYVNVHTSLFPAGAVRGQLQSAEREGVLLATGVRGLEEVGPGGEAGVGDPDGSGVATVAVSRAARRVCVELWVRDISLPAAAAHIHAAPAGTNGPVVVPLPAPDAAGAASGCARGLDQSVVEALAARPADHYVNVHTTDFPQGAVRGQLAPVTSNATPSGLPEGIASVMSKPRYADATWSLLVADVETGESFYELNADQMSLTGSTRKLFSVGTALAALGADDRRTTPVHRIGSVGADGRLHGDLVLVASGDLTFGGRRIDADTVDVTDFDHNDANGLGTALLTPQDPLFGLDRLAADVRASGITSVSGDVAIDDRLFEAYRVPNGNLLISPMLVNENQVDVIVTPTQPGEPATVEHRPRTGAFAVEGTVQTTAAGTDSTVTFSGDNLITCLGRPDCSGEVSGGLPEGYEAPLSGIGSLVGTFRVEDPLAFARTAFIEALQRHGVTVDAPTVAPNPGSVLPAASTYAPETRVATFQSAPFAQNAKLVLKVSLNLGANLDLSLFGVEQGQRTIDGALAAEREALIEEFRVDGDQFDFPTNGSGTPDSRAAPRALVQMLTAMSGTPVAEPYLAALPVMGVDGSLATAGTTLPGRGHVFAKPGTTIAPGPDGETLELKAQNLAGYIETRSGRRVAYALMVNDAGPVVDIGADVGAVFQDEAAISSFIYESL